jgi:hypothetical protein
MNQRQDLDERLRAHLVNEATPRAPDWVLQNLLDSVQSTPQRHRRWMPWRYLHMTAPFKIAVGTALVALAFAGGLAVQPLGSDTGNGGLSPAPSGSPGPSTSPLPSPMDMTGWLPFTSARHGFSLRYPATWFVRKATAPWVFGDPVDHDLPNDAATDELDTPTGGVFWLASQPIPPADASADPGDPNDPTCWPPIAEWPVIHLREVDAHYHGGANCGFWETQIVAGGRLYALASSNDVPLDVYKAVMSTVTLDPAAADDSPATSSVSLGSPSPLPSGS